MSALQTTAIYASSSSLEFNEELGVYVGQVIASDGTHVIEGPNAASVQYEIDAILREEYDRMVRDVTVGREEGKSKGRSIGGGSSSRDNERDDKIEGEKIHRHTAGMNISRTKTWVELVMGAVSLSHGNFLEAGFSALSLAASEWFENVESIWDKKPKKKIFAVYFGGILITATSRSALRKKLIRQRNKRVQLIMTSVRKHDHERENASSAGNLSLDAKRLRKKKQKAELLRPKKWERRVSPQGQQTGWRSQAIDLKTRMKGKKNRAKELWAQRL